MKKSAMCLALFALAGCRTVPLTNRTQLMLSLEAYEKAPTRRGLGATFR